MGHEIQYFSYDEKADKTKIYEELNEYAERNSDSGGGLDGPIKWKDITCDTYADAVDYIDKIDNGWYDLLAVKYREPTKPLTSKTLTTLQERRKKEIEKSNTYYDAHSIKNLKAEFIGCPCCGSKLKRERLYGENCPLCRTDLRSKTTLDALQRYSNNIKDIESKIKAEEKALAVKNAKSAKIKWLVKIEYHV